MAQDNDVFISAGHELHSDMYNTSNKIFDNESLQNQFTSPDNETQDVTAYMDKLCLLTGELESGLSEADNEEKQRLINQILELQHTLEDLSSRVETVKADNLKLRQENQILGQYIENMMAASSVFQSSSPRIADRRIGALPKLSTHTSGAGR